MKKAISTLVIIVCFGVSTKIMAEDRLQIRGSGLLYAPGGSATTGGDETELQSVDWDKGSGFEIQAIYWLSNSLWGVAGSIGKATWEIKDYDVMHQSNGYTFGDLLEGDADLTIIGASVFRTLFSDYGASRKLNGSIEGGIRFVSFDSNITGLTGIGDEVSADLVWYQALEIDDSIIGLLGMNLDYAVSDEVSLFAQAGIQFDLDKGGVVNSVSGLGTYKAGETELQAAFGKVGISVSL